MNGKPREAPELEPLAPGPGLIDAAAGAPKSELDAIKATSAPNDGSDAPGSSAEVETLGADARSRPDAVFVSDDEADQEAVSEVIAKAGSPGSRGAGFESSRGRRARRFSTSTAQSRDPTPSRAACRPRTCPRACVSGCLTPPASCTSSWTRLTARRSPSSLAISRGLPSDDGEGGAAAATVYDAYLRGTSSPPPRELPHARSRRV